jgi:hypothetical protein
LLEKYKFEFKVFRETNALSGYPQVVIKSICTISVLSPLSLDIR